MAETSIAPDVIRTHEPSDQSTTPETAPDWEVSPNETTETLPANDQTNTFKMTIVGEVLRSEKMEKKDAEVQCEILAKVLNEAEIENSSEVTSELKLEIQSLEESLKDQQNEKSQIIESHKKVVMEYEISSTKTVKEYEEKLGQIGIENSKLEEKLQVLQEQYSGVMKTYKTSVTEYEVQKSTVAQEYETKLGEMKINQTKLEERIQALEKEKDDAIKKNRLSLNETKEQLETQKLELEEKLEMLEDEMEDSAEKDREQSKELEESENEIKDLKNENAKLEKTVQELKDENQQIGEMKIYQTKLEDRIRALEKEKDDAITKNNDSKEQLETQKTELEDKLETLQDEKEDSAEKDREQSKELKENENEIKNLKSANKKLEKTVQELKDENQQILEKLKESLADDEFKKSPQLQNTTDDLKETVASLRKENQITLNKCEKQIADMEASKEIMTRNYEKQIQELKQEKNKMGKNDKETKSDNACLKFKVTSTESSYEKRIEEVRIEMREKCELEIKDAEEAARVALIRKYEDMLTQVGDIKQEILITFTESVKNYELKISEIHKFYELKLETLRQQQEDEQNEAAAKEIEALQKKCDDLEEHYKDIIHEMKNEMKENWENERKEMEEKFEKEKEVLIEENEKGGDEFEAKIQQLSESYEHKISQMVLEYSALEERYYSSIRDLEIILEKMKMPIERSTITCVVKTTESREETIETKTSISADKNHLQKEEKEIIPGNDNQKHHPTDNFNNTGELAHTVKNIKSTAVKYEDITAENGKNEKVDEKENVNEVNEHTLVQDEGKQNSDKTDDMKQNQELADDFRAKEGKAVTKVDRSGKKDMDDAKQNLNEVNESTPDQVEYKKNSRQTDKMKQSKNMVDAVREIKSKTANDVGNTEANGQIVNEEEKENTKEVKQNTPDLSREPTPLCPIVDSININREQFNVSPEQTKSLISIKYSRKCFHEIQEDTITIEKDQEHKTSTETRKVIPDFQKVLNMLKEKQEIEELLTSLQNEIADEQLNFLHAMQFKKDGEFNDYLQSSVKQLIKEKLPLEAELRVTIQEILELLEDDGLRQNSRLIQKKAERKDEIESRLETIYESIHSEPMRAAESLTCLLKAKNRHQDKLQNLEEALKRMKEEIESEMKLDASFVDILPEKLIIDLCLST